METEKEELKVKSNENFNFHHVHYSGSCPTWEWNETSIALHFLHCRRALSRAEALSSNTNTSKSCWVKIYFCIALFSFLHIIRTSLLCLLNHRGLVWNLKIRGRSRLLTLIDFCQQIQLKIDLIRIHCEKPLESTDQNTYEREPMSTKLGEVSKFWCLKAHKCFFMVNDDD